MDIKKLTESNSRLAEYLKEYSATRGQLFDIVKRLEIEEAKDYLEQYMAASKKWYEGQEEYFSSKLVDIEHSIELLTRKIKEYGKE